jgi:hypothetical protein
MRVSFTPEYEEGDEITEKGANGVVCVSYKAPDTLKRITMELAICEPDPELTALLSGGLLLRKNIGSAADPNNQSVGWAAPGVGDDPAGNGVAIEAWSHAVSGGKRTGVLPYFHWVFPYAKFRQSGDRVIENGLLANTFEGYGLGNVNFKAGCDGRWEYPVAAERPYAYARTSWAPIGLRGFYTWTDNSTDQVVFTASNALNASTINVSTANLASNVVSLIFSAAPAIAANDEIYVTNIGKSFNGTFTVASVSANTITYSSTADNVATFTVVSPGRVQLSNSVTETRPSTPVATNALTDAVGYDKYNVPGNIDYNPANVIDNIIIANEIGARSSDSSSNN